MKTFCTEGPVDPARNYFVSRKSLLKQGLAKVDDWRYFTLFAPRQSGKSTYFKLLCSEILCEKPEWLPVWISFEHYHKPSKNISNVVNKARQYPEIMMQVLFDGPINFTAYNEQLSFLRVNGVIVDEAGQCAIAVPIYKKCLYQAFKPLMNGNGEMRHFKNLMSLRNLEQGKRQVAAYVRRTGQEEGYLVVFSDVHPEGSRGEELVDGVRLHSSNFSPEYLYYAVSEIGSKIKSLAGEQAVKLCTTFNQWL